jgi:hypothetical protein
MATLADIPLDQINEIGRVGLVGAVAIILGFILWRREKKFETDRKAWDVERATIERERLAERAVANAEVLNAWKEVGQLVRESNVVTEARNVGLNAMASATERQTEALREQTTAFSRFLDLVKDAADSNKKLREALLTAGGLRPKE